jgi:hypothetical protein
LGGLPPVGKQVIEAVVRVGAYAREQIAKIPYHLKTDNPGGQAAPGKFLRFTEKNWMAHGQPARPGFIDTAAWEEDLRDYRNELGDSNTLTEWDPHWCGLMVPATFFRSPQSSSCRCTHRSRPGPFPSIRAGWKRQRQ